MSRDLKQIAQRVLASSYTHPALSDYASAKAHADMLNAEMTKASDRLNAFPSGAMGLTPDSVRSTPEFKKAKADFDKAFAACRAFNAVYVKKFKKERNADRNNKYRPDAAASTDEFVLFRKSDGMYLEDFRKGETRKGVTFKDQLKTTKDSGQASAFRSRKEANNYLKYFDLNKDSKSWSVVIKASKEAASTQEIKVTFHLKDLSDEFYTGFGESIKGLMTMTDEEKFKYLNKTYQRKELKVKMKIGTGQFRDAVDLNSMLRGPCKFDFKLEPRVGYKLATFYISKA